MRSLWFSICIFILISFQRLFLIFPFVLLPLKHRLICNFELLFNFSDCCRDIFLFCFRFDASDNILQMIGHWWQFLTWWCIIFQSGIASRFIWRKSFVEKIAIFHQCWLLGYNKCMGFIQKYMIITTNTFNIAQLLRSRVTFHYKFI